MADNDVAVTPDVAAAPAAPDATPSHGAIDDTASSLRADIGRLAREGAEQGELNTALATVAAKGDNIALADLRTLPGMEKYSDAELTAAWDDVRGVTKPATASPAADPAKARNYKVYIDGKEVADPDKLTFAQLQKAEFGYQANGKEQRRNLDGVMRNVSLAHYKEERLTTLQQNLQTALEHGRKTQGELGQLNEWRTTANRALDAAVRGNYEPLKAMLEEYAAALNAPPAADAAPATSPDEQHVATGVQVYHNYIVPEATKLAQEYGLEADKVAEAIMFLVSQEPKEFATPQRLQQIVETEIREHLENFTQNRAPATEDPKDVKIRELEAQLAKGGSAATATQHNERVDAVHARRRAAPPSHSTVPGPAGSIESPNFESANDAKTWLKNVKL